VLDNGRMLGMSERQLNVARLLAVGAVVDVLLAPHSVGFAVVGAVVGDISARRRASAI